MPTIETIIEDLVAGTITKQQAIVWLHEHAADAGRDLREDFASHGLTGWRQCDGRTYEQDDESAYKMADAMLIEKIKK